MTRNKNHLKNPENQKTKTKQKKINFNGKHFHKSIRQNLQQQAGHENTFTGT